MFPDHWIFQRRRIVAWDHAQFQHRCHVDTLLTVLHLAHEIAQDWKNFAAQTGLPLAFIVGFYTVSAHATDYAAEQAELGLIVYTCPQCTDGARAGQPHARQRLTTVFFAGFLVTFENRDDACIEDLSKPGFTRRLFGEPEIRHMLQPRVFPGC